MLAPVGPFVMTTGRPPLMLLTNYRGAGIGDFGLELAAWLRRSGGDLLVEETAPSGPDWRLQLRRAASWPGPLIINVGLTGWGPSPLRNFWGFRSLAGRCRIGRPTVVLVHHAIEMLAEAESGYRVSTPVRWGAHRALAGLSQAPGVAFTPALSELLRDRYGWTVRIVTPIPCTPPVQPPRWNGSAPTVVGLGYWAPYKGIPTFLRVAERLRGRARFVLTGEPHRVLSERKSFRERLDSWRSAARAAGVETPGFVPKAELSALLSGRVVAFLPYDAASGASASLATLAGFGVPAVTSDLPEFRYVAAQGGAVEALSGGVEAYAARVTSLLTDKAVWEAQVARQVVFAREHSWEDFASRIRTLLSDPPGSAPRRAEPR